MPIQLSDKTRRAAAILLSEDEYARIESRLVSEISEEIPFCRESTPEGMERIRFSILKLISEDSENEKYAFDLAKIDWRDLFMAAGFGESATEHERWYEAL